MTPGWARCRVLIRHLTCSVESYFETWLGAVPSHTRPVLGERRVHEVLTVYMAGVQYVHDQTVRRMNEGLPPIISSGESFNYLR